MEKQELELFRQGQFVIEDEEKEDAGAPTASTEVPVEVSFFFTQLVNLNNNDTVLGSFQIIDKSKHNCNSC